MRQLKYSGPTEWNHKGATKRFPIYAPKFGAFVIMTVEDTFVEVKVGCRDLGIIYKGTIYGGVWPLDDRKAAGDQLIRSMTGFLAALGIPGVIRKGYQEALKDPVKLLRSGQEFRIERVPELREIDPSLGLANQTVNILPE